MLLYLPEKISYQIEKHQLRFWRIYQVPGNPRHLPAPETVTKSTNRVDVFVGGENATPAEVAREFILATDNLPDGKYLAHVSSKSSDGAGGFYLYFQVGQEASAGIGQPSAGINGAQMTQDMLQKYVNSELEKVRQEMAAERQKLEQERQMQAFRDEIRELQAENKELRSIEGPINMIGQAFAQHVTKMVPGLMGGKGPIGQSQDDLEDEEPLDLNATQAQTAAALETLANKVGDHKLSQALTKLAQEDPDKLEMLLNML